MNRFNDFMAESAEIERLNREATERGEHGPDEGLLTPMMPEPCRTCVYVVGCECIAGVCMDFEMYEGEGDDF